MRRKCDMPFKMLKIQMNGDVFACPQGQLLANLYTTGPMDIWNSPRMLELREQLDTENYDEMCRKCTIVQDFKDEQPERGDEQPEREDAQPERMVQLLTRQIAEQNRQIAEKDGQIAAQNRQIAVHHRQIAEKEGRIDEKDWQIAAQNRRIDDMLHSMSWRLTRPVRYMGTLWNTMITSFRRRQT